VIEAVNETGDAGQIYLVRLIQKGSAGETTLQTQRVIPEHKAYSLTLQEVSGGFLLAAHPTHTADVIRHIYATWEDAKQKFALHLGSDAAELEGLHKKLQSASVAHSVLQGHHLVTPEVVDALCK